MTVGEALSGGAAAASSSSSSGMAHARDMVSRDGRGFSPNAELVSAPWSRYRSGCTHTGVSRVAVKGFKFNTGI